MGFHEVKYDSGTNPFTSIRVLNDQGSLEIIIADDTKDLKQLRITDAKFFDGEEKYFPTTLVPGGITHESSEQSKASFWFEMKFADDRQFARPPFYLKISGLYGGKPFAIDAKFTDQVHYQMINLNDALDHG